MNSALKLVTQGSITNEVSADFFQTDAEIKQEFVTAAKTSIARKSVSAPLKQFLAHYSRLIQVGSAMNFAKGREKESLDTNAIKEITGHCAEYDYTFQPDVSVLTNGFYNFIYCGYCTNVLPPMPRKQVWNSLANLCNKDNGIVVVSARSNTDRGIRGIPCFDGVRTKHHTFQKGYSKNTLKNEALEVFSHAVEIAPKGSYRLVICSHQPITL